MSIGVELPALGESVTEGTVARWLVKVGDVVEVDQPLVEVTTDKVDAEIPAPARGVVEEILVNEGDVVAVGAPLVLLNPEVEGARISESQEPSEAPAESDSEPATEAPSVDRDAEGTPARADAPAATPLAARVAEQQSVELREVEGTGPRGRITKADVLKRADAPPARASETPAAPAAKAPTAPTAPTAPSPQGAASTRSKMAAYFEYKLQPDDRVIPMSPQRKLIAAHMVYSKHTSPHVGTVAEVDMSGVARVRSAHKAAFQQEYGFGLTYLPFIVSATVRALREFPELNASVVDESIVEKKDINVGMAVETEKGLVVPVLRNADRLSLSGLAAAIDDLSSRARSKKLSPDELRGGTFTVSNPGRKGNLYGFAIINQPQVGILRMGELVKRPVVREVDGDDAIVIRQMMHLALSYDHRAVDGSPANGFLYRIRELLEAAEFDL